MAIGEPPGRRRTFTRREPPNRTRTERDTNRGGAGSSNRPSRKPRSKNADGQNDLLQWMQGMLAGVSGGLIGAADMPGNAARNAGAFLPTSTLAATGSPAAAVEGVNRAASDAYMTGAQEADKFLLAASLVPAVGIRNIGRLGAQAGTRGFRASPRQIAKQRERSLQAMRDGGADMRPIDPRIPDNPRMMNQAAEAAQRSAPQQVVPPARFPSNRAPRTDAPREPIPSGMPKKDLPQPPAASKAAEAVDDGPIKLNIPQGLRGVDEASGNSRVKVSWDGEKKPNHQQFKQWDADAGKYVPWKEGFKQANKRWKTRQTKSDVTNPNANPARVEQEVSQMTPQEYARFRAQQAAAADPEGVATTVGRANEADLKSVSRFDEINSTMRQGPPGTSPRAAARPKDPGQGSSTARGSRPERKSGESQKDFDARLKDWEESRSVANLKKSRQSLRRPKQREGESASAYKKRVDEWRKSLDEGSETYGSTRASQVARTERARVDTKLREAQPRAVESSDPSLGGFRPNPLAPDYIPSGPSAAPVGRFNPYDLPQYTPTRGKGSTRLRNVGKAADESPKSNVADKPVEAVNKPSAKKSTAKKSSAKKTTAKKTTAKKTTAKKTKKDQAQEETATQQEAATQTGEAEKVVSKPSAKKSTAKKSTAKKPSAKKSSGKKANTESPRQFISPDMARDATRRNQVQVGRKNQVDAGTAEEARLKGMAGATEGVKSRPVFPEAQTSRGKRGYLTAGDEKAIKERAKDIRAAEKGGRTKLTGKQKFAAGTVAAGFPAAAAASISQGMLKDAEKKEAANMQQVAADAAEEAVKAEESNKKPKSTAARTVLRDKYGRKITREEYERREKFRERIKDMSPAERKAAREKEMKRREKWRTSLGKQLFGKGATKSTRNLNLREGVSSRKVNREVLAADSTAEAVKILKKYTRKKKD